MVEIMPSRQKSLELEFLTTQSTSASQDFRSTSLDLVEETDRFVDAEAGTIVESVSKSYLFCLTVGIGGLQVIWTAIMSQGSPYLFSLGVPTYIVSLVWLAGPLCGAIIQPCVGILSDRCQHRWGKRKPFIIFGTLATIICMLALPWSASLQYILDCIFGKSNTTATIVTIQLTAIIWIWALNVAVQPVQSGLRALIVDCCPPHQQAQASAFASCAQGVGSIVGYAAGSASLPDILPWLGDSEFKVLCAIASIILGSTVAVTCFVVKEDQKGIDAETKKAKLSPRRIVDQILWNISALSSKTARVCSVQFFSWIGWFTFLFYITSYVGEIYQGRPIPHLGHSSHQPPADSSVPKPESIRYGTLIMIMFALTALITNLLLPLIVSTKQQDQAFTGSRDRKSSLQRALTLRWLTIPRAWTASHILYTVIISCTAFTDQILPTAALVTVLGTSWALTQWAPLALISTELAKRHQSNGAGIKASRSSDRAGAIMGVYNIAIATPQIVAAMGSSIIFWVLSRWGITGPEAMGWVIRTGALSSSVAAWLSLGIEGLE